MSMIQLSGTLINTFKAPPRAGTEEPERDKIQIMGEVVLLNGETRMDLMTITVPDAAKYSALKGSPITLPVGVFAPAKGQVVFFINQR